jgi:hypothetical protein
MVEKIDLRKQLRHLYNPSAKQAQIIQVPRFQFVMIDGTVAPGTPPAESEEFQDCLQAAYGAAFTLKFTSKLRKVDPIDYTVMALEGLWWVDSGVFDFQKKEPWRFTLMILQPDHIKDEMFVEAIEQIKKKRDHPSLARLRLASFEEGLAVHIMHIGPYSSEPDSLEKMVTFANENGYNLHGKHHEIYLGDPRRANPEKLKTILRHPVEKI